MQVPSCGLGVCLCSPHGANTAKDVWRESLGAVVGSGSHGIRVRPPRGKSAADRAGLQSGDIIVAVDDQAIQNESWDSLNMQQDAIRKHQPGEIVRFRVQRASGDCEVPVTRP
jgi:S1-C subfamily serine protease